MPERRFELAAIFAAKGWPSPSAATMDSLSDIVDEGVLGASNHVALALPLIAAIAAESHPSSVAEAFATAHFIARVRGAGAPIVANAIHWQLSGLSETTEDVAMALAERAQRWDREARLRRERLVAGAANHLAGHRRPLIYDYSSTVADIVSALANAKRLDAIIIPESRALDGGRRYMAALSALGAPVHFLPDCAIEYAATISDMVLLGAESVTTDGGVSNTVGSIASARAAQALGVPVYGAADLFKIGSMRFADLPSPEPRTYSFLLRKGETADTSAPEIETVPPELISAILTEKGAIAPGVLADAVKDRDHH